jgi:hypothetical protein
VLLQHRPRDGGLFSVRVVEVIDLVGLGDRPDGAADPAPRRAAPTSPEIPTPANQTSSGAADLEVAATER